MSLNDEIDKVVRLFNNHYYQGNTAKQQSMQNVNNEHKMLLLIPFKRFDCLHIIVHTICIMQRARPCEFRAACIKREVYRKDISIKDITQVKDYKYKNKSEFFETLIRFSVIVAEKYLHVVKNKINLFYLTTIKH